MNRPFGYRAWPDTPLRVTYPEQQFHLERPSLEVQRAYQAFRNGLVLGVALGAAGMSVLSVVVGLVIRRGGA